MRKKTSANKIIEILDRIYPDAGCSLNFSNPLELLIATILSAQCTDERVNKITASLFRKYRHAQDYAEAKITDLEADIHSAGFFRNKAKNIQNACKSILRDFQGKVPDTMEELLTLSGVARKTANVVLGNVYGRSEGIVVDTHVFRISRRLGLSHSKTPEKTEADLMALIPRDHWIKISHQWIRHGRALCKARKPLCKKCPLEQACPRINV